MLFKMKNNRLLTNLEDVDIEKLEDFCRFYRRCNNIEIGRCERQEKIFFSSKRRAKFNKKIAKF